MTTTFSVGATGSDFPFPFDVATEAGLATGADVAMGVDVATGYAVASTKLAN